MTEQAALQNGLARIRLRFLDTLDAYLSDIEGFAEMPVFDDQTALESALFALHKLAGSAAPLGFATLSRDARHAEEMLRADLAHLPHPRSQTLAAIGEVCREADAILEEGF